MANTKSAFITVWGGVKPHRPNYVGALLVGALLVGALLVGALLVGALEDW